MDIHLPKEKDRNFRRFDIFLIRFPPGFSSFDCPLTLLDISRRNLFFTENSATVYNSSYFVLKLINI